MATKPILIETPEGNGEATYDPITRNWLICLPWTDIRFHGRKTDVETKIKLCIAEQSAIHERELREFTRRHRYDQT